MMLFSLLGGGVLGPIIGDNRNVILVTILLKSNMCLRLSTCTTYTFATCLT